MLAGSAKVGKHLVDDISFFGLLPDDRQFMAFVKLGALELCLAHLDVDMAANKLGIGSDGTGFAGERHTFGIIEGVVFRHRELGPFGIVHMFESRISNVLRINIRTFLKAAYDDAIVRHIGGRHAVGRSADLLQLIGVAASPQK